MKHVKNTIIVAYEAGATEQERRRGERVIGEGYDQDGIVIPDGVSADFYRYNVHRNVERDGMNILLDELFYEKEEFVGHLSTSGTAAV